MKTLAIFSPNQNAYSETFIQAHKKLPFNIKYYYGGFLPTQLEDKGSLYQFNVPQKIKIRTNKYFNLSEHALINSLKKEKIDCVLVEYGPTACSVLKIIKYLKLPLVVHFHGYDASVKNVLKQYAESYKEIFSYASSIVAVSQNMKERLIGMGCPIDKITVSVYGPNPVFYNNNPSYRNKRFIAVGRFVEKKAPYLTIAAFNKIVDECPEAKLVMVGEGELLPLCQRLAKGLSLENNIDFKGVQTSEEIRLLFENSLAFVQHSIVPENGDSEGTPVIILEAQASALPVISTNHAGISEVVINNETGLLVDELDVEGMTGHMKRLLTEKGLAEKLGKAGRKRIRENFTLDMHLETLEKSIRLAIEKEAN